jgi:MSHA biogenesis protein MshI
VIFRWKKQLDRGWRAALVPAANETGFAVVQKRQGDSPLLQHYGVLPTFEVKAEHVLAAMLPSRLLARTPVSGVIRTDDYQLVQVEAPKVPAAEIRAAVRWKLREMITFPVEDAVVDVFELPAPARESHAAMVMAVAARNTAVQSLVATIGPRARRFDTVDVPELCLRNLSARLPQDERGLALLALSDNVAHLLLTRAGVLYLTRRIDLSRASLQRAQIGDEPPEIDAAALALELQRSLDYYESFYDQPPITDLVLAPADARARRLATTLADETSLQVELFFPDRLFNLAHGVEIDASWNGLIALGAALRGDEG